MSSEELHVIILNWTQQFNNNPDSLKQFPMCQTPGDAHWSHMGMQTVLLESAQSYNHRQLICGDYCCALPDHKPLPRTEYFLPNTKTLFSQTLWLPCPWSLTCPRGNSFLTPPALPICSLLLTVPKGSWLLFQGFKIKSSFSLPHWLLQTRELHQYWLGLAYNYFLSSILSDVHHKYKSTHSNHGNGPQMEQQSTQL